MYYTVFSCNAVQGDVGKWPVCESILETRSIRWSGWWVCMESSRCDCIRSNTRSVRNTLIIAHRYCSIL